MRNLSRLKIASWWGPGCCSMAAMMLSWSLSLVFGVLFRDTSLGPAPVVLHSLLALHITQKALCPFSWLCANDVKACGFISDHALIKCSLALPTPASKPVNIVSYQRYHRIDMDKFKGGT